MAAVVYAIWTELDLHYGGGLISAFFQGAIIFGGLAILRVWAKSSDEKPKDGSVEVAQESLDSVNQFDKRDVAVEFLDAAVSEHLDHARYFAAYNLAAVAEELLSGFLKSAKKADSSTMKIRIAKAMSRALGQSEGDDKTWRREFFTLKNKIKHMDGEVDRYFEANIEANARQKIGDAVSNLQNLGLIKSSQVRRFDEYRLARRQKDTH